MSLMTNNTHISVTIDFLRLFPDLDIRKEADLYIALYRSGFEVIDQENNPVKVELLTDKLVRCRDKPYLCRKTTIFAGRMRKDFLAPRIYDNIDILDVRECKSTDLQLVNELAYDIPVFDKPNTRKYTKRKDIPETLEGISADDLDNFSDIYGG